MDNSLLYANICSGYRFIQDGKAFDRYFVKPERKDAIKIVDGDVNDTLDLMKRVVWTYIDDTRQLASILKRSTIKATCQAIWEFVYNNLQYKFDQQGLEQLRRPARSWSERKTGVDCDCMSIFISSILTNLEIPHSFRITKYSKPSWQHVYVIVPDKNGTLAIDAVVSRFNYEKPYTAKKDYDMNLQGIDIAVLSGYDDNDADPLNEALFGLDFNEDEELGSLDDEQQLEAIYKHLVATRNAVAQNPNVVVGVDDPQGFIKMLNYAIEYWHTDKRQEALDHLARYENRLNIKNGFSGIDEDDLYGYDDDDLEGYDYDELGFIKPKKLFRSIGKAAKKVGKTVGKTVGKGAKAVGKTAAKVGKTVGKAILKFNPITISARAGFLLAIRLNMKKMGTKLKWAYATQEQAARKGINAAQWQRAKNALTKVEKLYVSKLQGSASSLRNAVLKGKAGNLNGMIEYVEDFSEFQGLGIAPAAALAAAVPVIKIVMDIFKKDGMVAHGEDTNTDNLSQELDSSANSTMQSLEQEDSQFKLIPNTLMKQNFGQKLLHVVQKAGNIANKATQVVQAVHSPVKTTTAQIAPQTTTTTPYNAAFPTLQTQAQTQSLPEASASGGIMTFIKANPIPTLVVGGIGAFVLYKMLSPKSAAQGVNGLSGMDGTRKRTGKKKPVPKKSAKKKANSQKTTKSKTTPKRSVRRVKLF